jgi:Superfamily I DNA and RNA helicases
MEVMPSEYQHIELSRNEKIFVRNILANEQFGYLFMHVNPALNQSEIANLLVYADGVIMLRFFNDFTEPKNFEVVMPVLTRNVYEQTKKIIVQKLKSNKVLLDKSGLMKFPVSIVYVFPALSRESVSNTADLELKVFIAKNCLFKEDLAKVRSDFDTVIGGLLNNPITDCSLERMTINDDNVNSILQRLVPEYITIRVSVIADEDTKRGADNDLLVVTEDDKAVKAFRLDEEQINIVNKINKGEQLILACAGSGKSVLLTAKCFKAATMNPDKKFLITCFNKNLHSLYTWFIDQAGLKAKNVECLTFHKLCRKLLKNNGFYATGDNFERWVNDAIDRLKSGQIRDRYYGIFIDEVQEFDTEWYKFCFNLLENKESDDHLFVICGDKTQKLINQQQHGRAPWNAGEGYPNYRGGNKNIRIERNYRNCIEINEFINCYVTSAKQYLFNIQPDAELDPDMFLRGKSLFHGQGVKLKHLRMKTSQGEANAIYDSMREIHDEGGIPYDEIAVIMYNGEYKGFIPGWNDNRYNLVTPLAAKFASEDVPFCRMYDTDASWGSRYGEDGGVKLIKFLSTLGLDFRAAIVCGLVPFGVYDRTKAVDWDKLRADEDEFEEKLKSTQDNIRMLYVACTRAKEILHIILPDRGDKSVYLRMLEDACSDLEGTV